jgi:hypothetical protein
MKLHLWLLGLILSCGLASAQTPLLQYTFDEASGSALDYGSGISSPGTFEGGATRSANTPSGSGFAADFLTESPYAHILSGDADKLDGLNQLTLTTWLNLSSYTAGNNRLAAKQAGGAFGGFSWNMNATPNTGTVGPDNFRLGLFVGNNVSSDPSDFASAFSTDDVGADNQWVFFAVTYDGTAATDNVRFYMGDVNTPAAQVGTPLTIVQLTIDSGTARFGVGFTDAAPTADTSAIGLQDDVRVYGTALDLNQLDGIRLQAVPEPSTWALIGGGLAALMAFRRMRDSRG